MKNLTEVSLKNRPLVWYFIIMTAIGGVFSYFNLGRMEDPNFTIRQMVITAVWSGATAQQMQEQVTDKLERKLQDTPSVDNITSDTIEGMTTIYIELKEEFDKNKIREAWHDVRNLCEGEKRNLPDGVIGPFYNDRFDDVYGSIYAVTGDGFNYEELRKYAEKMRRLILTVPDVKKVELIGEQTEKIYVEISKNKLSSLGISPTNISNALNGQNAMTPVGKVDTDTDNVYLRVSGQFNDIEDIRSLPVNAGERVFRLGDIATVERRFIEPADPKMFFNGEPAIGIAVSMEDGGNILELGKNLGTVIAAFQQDIPTGIEIHQVSDQPKVVDDSIREFVKTLSEAIIIVLIVSFLSLGIRTGLVVAGCIPLVLAGVFLFMYVVGIDLHKISLGTLIIAMGLLVDDAIIAVEMMSVKLEEGLNRFEAACYAFDATAKPMLTGTLITCSGFIPVAFSEGMASEFCSTLFPVICAALILSWIVSVMVAPLFGTHLIKVKIKKDSTGKINPYDSRFYNGFRRVIEFCLSHRSIVLITTLILFIVSIMSFGRIKEEFFPPSMRPEILVEIQLPKGSSMKATQSVCDRMSNFLEQRKEFLSNYSYYVGEYAPRFVLTIDPKTDSNNIAQFVIVTKDTEAREKLTEELREAFLDEFFDVRCNLQFIQTGPPADYPVMLRVTGYDTESVKKLANQVVNIVAADSNNTNVQMDWNEKSKILHLEFDQEKLRAMGLNSQSVAQTLYTELTGATAAQFYTGDRTIDIDLRIDPIDRQNLSQLKELPIYLGEAGYVQLEQIAKISYDAEDGMIKRRDLLPTITVSAEIKKGTANDATQAAYDATEELRKNLPIGCKIEVGGALEESESSTEYLLKTIPLMIFVITTLLMLQLRNALLMLLTILTAPLGLIGVVAGMLITDSAMGFVAILGILALSGMIIRNSIILIDQIEKHIESGEKTWDAIIDSAILRFRPIMLTAAAAILGMIPLMISAFWGPMAVAIASGLLAATVLTLLVLPTMYAAFYKVYKD